MTRNDARAAAAATAIRATHSWFEANSGWAEPAREALVEWLADGVCQCPDECWVAPAGVCEHGLASWWLVLRAMGEHEDLTSADRPATLTNAPNFRDLGGVSTRDGRRVRHGELFRSGVLDALDDTDRSVLKGLGLRTVIDLRGDDERSQRPNALPGGLVELHHAVTDVSAHPQAIIERIARGEVDGLGAPMLRAGNRHFVQEQAHRFGEVVRLLFDARRRPAVVHCTAGKDRTGFTVACVLWSLGVEHDVVVADYLRTNEVMLERHERTLADAAARGIDVEPLEAMLRVRRDYIDAAHEAAVQRFGSLEAFVRDGLGVSDALRRRACEELLEPR